MLSTALIILIISFVSQAQNALIQDARGRAGGIDAIISGEIAPQYVQAINEVEGVRQTLAIHQGHFYVQSTHNSTRQLNVYTIGTENSPIARARYEHESDISSGQAVISENVSAFLEVNIGEYIVIDNKDFQVIEIVGTHPGNVYGFELLLISFNDFSQLIGSQNGNYLTVEFFDPQNTIEMHRQIRQVDTNMTITLIADEIDEAENLSSLHTFSYIFSALVILACAFMVISNFQSFIENYKVQFSIMRSFGTSGMQLWKILFAQGFIVVGSATIVGILLALFLHTFVFHIFSNLLSLAVTVPLMIPTALLVATIFFVIIIVALFVPSVQCSFVLPLQIAREIDRDFSPKKWKKVLGIALLSLSVLMFLISLIELLRGYQNRGLVVAMVFFYIPSFFLLFPFVIHACLNIIQKAFRRVSKGASDIAISNMKNNLITTRNIIFSICLVFIIAIFGSTMLRTIHNNVNEQIERDYFLDVAISDILAFNSQLDIQFLNELNAINGADNTVILSHGAGYLLTSDIDSFHYDVGYISLNALVVQGELDMGISDLSNIVVITGHFAELHNLSTGDALTLWYNPNLIREQDELLPITKSFVFRVGAIIDAFRFAPFVDIYIDWNNQILPPESFIFDRAFIRTDNIEETISSLSVLRRAYPEIRWSTLEDAIEINNAMFFERFGMFILVLVLVIVSLSLGVINTIWGGIYRRRREYAILRMIGTNQKTIARTVYLQVLLYAVLGITIGAISGILLSVVLVLMIERTSLVIDYMVSIGALIALSLALVFAIKPRVSKILKENMLMQISD